MHGLPRFRRFPATNAASRAASLGLALERGVDGGCGVGGVQRCLCGRSVDALGGDAASRVLWRGGEGRTRGARGCEAHDGDDDGADAEDADGGDGWCAERERDA